MAKAEKPQIKVLVAMSGGVDSSVAALLMKKAGYDVIGAFMKNWTMKRHGIGKCWKDEIIPAIKVAAKLGIPFLTFNFEEEYYKVIKDMYKSYKKGITPNPDIDCNQKVKFPLFWKEAEKMGIDYIVTGHHARIKKTKKGYELLRGKDEGKDQSYFLYRLTQDDLGHSLFPIGNYTKKEVREIARKAGFENYSRKSTVGLCFIGKINFKEFLKKKINPRKGKILDPEGRQIGTHDGIYYYTIGQRIGPRFGIDLERGRGKNVMKWYVARKIPKTNTIIAAPENHPLNFRKYIALRQPHWINEIPKKNIKVLARIRQVGELLPAILTFSRNRYHIALSKPITGVSEGQAIVLYRGKTCLGGGVISF
jgi:tRNA-specific 2-thiouridylase